VSLALAIMAVAPAADDYRNETRCLKCVIK